MSHNEFSLITRFFSDTGKTAYPARLSQGDDAAVVDVPAHMQLVMSVDTLIGGVHFPSQTSPADIAHKALAVNLSDLAAMAATPAWALLSITLPEFDEKWLEAFSASLKSTAEQYQIELIGGDTCRGPLSISVQVSGLVNKGAYVTRSGARPGDLIVVSGYLGDAAVGLAQLQQKLTLPRSLRERCVTALNRPVPRLQLGSFLSSYASAAIDLSDGLVGDLRHILEKSEVGAMIRQEDLPVNDWIIANQAYQYALAGGDDYEICFTMAAEHRSQIDVWNRQNPCCLLTQIGEINAAGYVLVDGHQKHDLNQWQGYQHFE